MNKKVMRTPCEASDSPSNSDESGVQQDVGWIVHGIVPERKVPVALLSLCAILAIFGLEFRSY